MLADDTTYLLNLMLQAIGYHAHTFIQMGFHTDANEQVDIHTPRCSFQFVMCPEKSGSVAKTNARAAQHGRGWESGPESVDGLVDCLLLGLVGFLEPDGRHFHFAHQQGAHDRPSHQRLTHGAGSLYLCMVWCFWRRWTTHGAKSSL